MVFQNKNKETMSREGALWIGGLENYMDEDFILKAMHSMGETNILSIKVIKNKFTGGAAGRPISKFHFLPIFQFSIYLCIIFCS